MTKEVYTAKEILFSLIKEYQIVQTELDNLKQYININKNKISELYFRLNYPNNESIKEIQCYISLREKKLDEILKEIKKKLNLFKYPITSTTFVKSNDGLYYPKKDIGIEINPTLETIFTTHIENIFLLSKNIMSTYNFSIDKKSTIETTDEWITFHYRNTHYLSYTGSTKVFSIMKDIEKVPTKLIYRSLETTFPKDIFSEYYQTIIEQNNIRDKQVKVIGYSENSREEKFQIIEEPKKIILKKKEKGRN